MQGSSARAEAVDDDRHHPVGDTGAVVLGGLAHHQEGLHFGRVWQMTLATGMIVLFALSANVLVDGLSEALDPRSQVGRRANQ